MYTETLDHLFITYASKQAFLEECLKRYSSQCDRYGNPDYHKIVNQCLGELDQELKDYQQEWVLSYLTVQSTFIRNPHTYVEAAREIGRIGIGDGNILKISEETCKKLLKAPRSEAEEMRDFTTSSFWSGIIPNPEEIGYLAAGAFLIGALVFLSVRYRPLSPFLKRSIPKTIGAPSLPKKIESAETVSKFSKAALLLFSIGFNQFFSS